MRTISSARESEPARRADGHLLSAVGIAAGLGTLLASSCCVIPLALGSIGAGTGAFALLTFLQPYRAVLLAVSFLAIGAAWLYYLLGAPAGYEEHGASCPAPHKSYGSLIILLFATAFLCIAAFWAFFETVLLQEIRGA